MKGYLPREGDVVLVRATVNLSYKVGDAFLSYKVGDAFVHIDVGDRAMGIQPADIASVESHVWKVGDTAQTIVGATGPDDPGVTIVAIHEDSAWVVRTGRPFTVLLVQLRPLANPAAPPPNSEGTEPTVQTAIGEDLDRLGLVYGVARMDGEVDRGYRTRILQRVAAAETQRLPPIPPMVPRRDVPEEREPPFEPDPPGTLTEQPIDPEDVF